MQLKHERGSILGKYSPTKMKGSSHKTLKSGKLAGEVNNLGQNNRPPEKIFH